jgi:hypothetical protein
MKMALPFLILLTIISLSSCKKENSTITSADARLRLSDDILKYDTVFVTRGSITQFVKIFNENNQILRLSELRLMGGAPSFYKMNVDGLPGTAFSNIDIAANDSLYVFVSVNIDPNAANLPFIVKDSIRISYNGNTRFVQLQAYGQNAIFLRNQKLTGNTVWNNTLPYVILGGIKVDTTATLTIQKGTRIYLHADAPFVVDGTLITNGEKYDSTRIVFRGDRLDDPYRDYPAAWPGINFRGQSKNNVLNYTTVKNAYQGIIAELPSVNANVKVTLNECIIDNAYDAGILGVNSSITGRNCLISNCGNNIGFILGGNYQFTHCTAASFSNSFIVHKDPVLIATNYLKQPNNTFLTASLNATFTNCIFWGAFGTVDDEAVADKVGSNPYNVTFNNCLFKVKTVLNPLITNNNGLANQNPAFDSVNTSRQFYNFRLKTGSPALNAGIATGVATDLDGKPRPVGLPDLGCYEK